MNSDQPAASVEARLDRLRGRALPVNHSARTISALAANPGCCRRAVMDAAGVDKQKIAAHIGYPAPFGQSRFAISRGNAFEARVKENGAAMLLTLLRDRLSLDVTEVGYTDFNDVAGNPSRELRHLRTRQGLTGPEHAPRTLFDHPLLRLRVAQEDRGRLRGTRGCPAPRALAHLLRRTKGGDSLTLPASRRLPAAAPVVSAAFYRFSGFTAATGPGDRAMRWNTHPFGMNSFDIALQTAADTGWALYELPHRHTLRTDAEAVEACAELAARLLLRGAVAVSERPGSPHDVSADRIAIGVAHRDQATAVKRALRQRAAAYPALGGPGRDVTQVAADTANRLQEREFDVMIMLHPLSGRRDATAFHLEAGRLCVLASRHRHACIVVARAGIPELLDAHPSAEPVHLGVPAKFPDGWEAHQSFMAHLAGFRVPGGA